MDPLNQTFGCSGSGRVFSTWDKLRFSIVILVSVGIIVGNLFSIVVFRAKNAKRFFGRHPRFFLTSLATVDATIGLFVCPSTWYSALYHCWPFGRLFCRIEALALSALFHISSLSLVVVAIDRYICICHPLKYHKLMTVKSSRIIIASVWIPCFVFYGITIFVFGQYVYDDVGVNCEPYYNNDDVTICAATLFYLPPAVVLIFAYGNIYMAAYRQQLRISETQTPTSLQRINIKAFKTLAIVTLGFFAAVTPWTITMLVMSFGINVPDTLNFLVTWLTIGNSMWNVIIYSLMNRKFRCASKEVLSRFFGAKIDIHEISVCAIRS